MAMTVLAAAGWENESEAGLILPDSFGGNRFQIISDPAIVRRPGSQCITNLDAYASGSETVGRLLNINKSTSEFVNEYHRFSISYNIRGNPTRSGDRIGGPGLYPSLPAGTVDSNFQCVFGHCVFVSLSFIGAYNGAANYFDITATNNPYFPDAPSDDVWRHVEILWEQTSGLTGKIMLFVDGVLQASRDTCTLADYPRINFHAYRYVGGSGNFYYRGKFAPYIDDVILAVGGATGERMGISYVSAAPLIADINTGSFTGSGGETSDLYTLVDKLATPSVEEYIETEVTEDSVVFGPVGNIPTNAIIRAVNLTVEVASNGDPAVAQLKLNGVNSLSTNLNEDGTPRYAETSWNNVDPANGQNWSAAKLSALSAAINNTLDAAPIRHFVGRYMRLAILASGNNNTYPNLIEVIAKSYGGDSDVCLQPGTTASASSTYDSTYSAQGPINGIIENVNVSTSRPDTWSPTGANIASADRSCWWQVDFGYRKQIAEIYLVARQSLDRVPTSVAIMYSDDGENWADALVASGLTYASDTTPTRIY